MSHWWLITGYPSYSLSEIKRERMIMLGLPMTSQRWSALCYFLIGTRFCIVTCLWLRIPGCIFWLQTCDNACECRAWWVGSPRHSCPGICVALLMVQWPWRYHRPCPNSAFYTISGTGLGSVEDSFYEWPVRPACFVRDVRSTKWFSAVEVLSALCLHVANLRVGSPMLCL
jgi:hypothetical protein